MAIRQSRIMREKTPEDSGKLGRELVGLFSVFCGLLIVLSLATFDSRDPWLNHVVSGVGRVYNKAGLFGSYIAGLLYDMTGFAAWIAPLFLCLSGARRLLNLREWVWWRWTGFALLALCLSFAGAARDLNMGGFFSRSLLPPGSGNISAHGGGIVGHMLYQGMTGWLSATGAFMLWLFALLLAVQMVTGLSWLTLGKTAGIVLWRVCLNLARKLKERGVREKRPPLEIDVSESSSLVGRFPAGQSAAFTRDVPFSEAVPPLASGIETPPDAAMPIRGISAAGEDGVPLRRAPESDCEAAFPTPDVRDFQEAPVAAQALPDDSAGQTAPAFSVPETLLSLASPQLASRRPEAEEDDLPPWVRDFEEDKLGVSGEALPAVSFRMPSAVAPIGEETEAIDFAVFAVNSDAGDTASAVPVAREEPDEPADMEDDTASAEDAIRTAEHAWTPEHAQETRDKSDTLPPAHAGEEAVRPAVEEFDAPSPLRDSPRKAGISLLPPVPEKIPLPSLDLLEAVPPSVGATPRGILEAKGRILMICLNDFGIQGELVGITPGPVVTMFEVRPAPGVRVSRIANLSDELALALKAMAVRIQAPVPGTDTVGIEIPNEVRETVGLKELLASRLFQESRSLLTLALGKDIAGAPAVADLAAMPHLLVAGATGAGKSVGINSIILSLIYKARPHEVKLLLVDPKRVEMAVYADLPHLVHPVVTEMALAKSALEWAVAEMERRYNAIAKASVRNIMDYNVKVAAFGDNPPPGMEDLTFLPYLVIIIDELADLMLVGAKEVETSIVRLAQLARAAGIHLILATQRPSVDVVTGLIKANFPCRIAFQVTSKHDSRTILDTVGAEHLLGKGDMLFKPAGGKFQRMHSPFVSDKSVSAVVDYWRSRQEPDYRIDFTDWSADGGGSFSAGGGSNSGGDISLDPLYNEAVEFVRLQGKASISLIQRKFRIGFNKAARFVEQMEQDGIIGPADGSRPRMIIR